MCETNVWDGLGFFVVILGGGGGVETVLLKAQIGLARDPEYQPQLKQDIFLGSVSLCILGCPRMQRSTCFCLPSAGILKMCTTMPG